MTVTREFKVIKTYPGSFPLNTIGEPNGFGMIFPCVSLNNVENYKEFIEEITPDYKILSLIHDKTLCYYNEQTKLFSFKGNIEGSTLEACLNSGWAIHSVERLSDGEVFTIGDRLTKSSTVQKFNLNNPALITKIGIIKNTDSEVIAVMCDKSLNGKLMFSIGNHLNNYNVILKDATKEKVMLVTEDNVDIYSGDDVYWVAVTNKTDDGQYRYGKYVHDGGTPSLNGNYKWFSTKELAESFILNQLYRK